MELLMTSCCSQFYLARIFRLFRLAHPGLRRHPPVHVDILRLRNRIKDQTSAPGHLALG